MKFKDDYPDLVGLPSHKIFEKHEFKYYQNTKRFMVYYTKSLRNVFRADCIKICLFNVRHQLTSFTDT